MSLLKLIYLTTLFACSGCNSLADKGSWGGDTRWPAGQQIGSALTQAARDPQTWIPLVGAVLLGVTGADKDLSRWAAEDQPIFGQDARDISDTLLDISVATYVFSAVVAPSDSLGDKARGLMLGVGALAVNNTVTQGLKKLTSRERPDGSNNLSFPSGHASNSSTAATLTASNLSYFPLPAWADASLRAGTYGLAAATGWARVEADVHHVTDVLAGYALGHFIARFFLEAFREENAAHMAVSYVPMRGGGVINLQVVLRKPSSRSTTTSACSC